MSFLGSYELISEIALVYAILSLGTFAALSSGLLSVAHVPIAGVAAFASAHLLVDTELPVELVMLIGVAIGVSVAWLLSSFILRLSSHWIALATIGLLLVFRILVLNGGELSGGPSGQAVPREIGTAHILVALALSCWLFARMRRSRTGLAIEAVRADADVAAALGIDTHGVRRFSFVLSGGLGGLGGVLLANLLQYLSPDSFYLPLAFLVLSAVVLGGRFHWFGAIVGALVFTALPEISRHVLDKGETLFNGLALILIILLLPGGLFEPGRGQRRRSTRKAAAEARHEANESDAGQISSTDDLVAPVTERTKSMPKSLLAPRSMPVADTDADGAALVIDHVSKSFGGVHAVRDLSFTVPTNSIFAIVGPNGAGKSTLLNLISGLELPDAGSIHLWGTDVSSLPPHQRARAGLSRTFQEVRLLDGLTALENVSVGRHMHRSSSLWQAVLALPSERRERSETGQVAQELMDWLGVIGRPDQFAGTLSYANQRRIEIARALAARPRILLLDEPTAGMHKNGTAAVGDLLKDLKAEGLTIIVIEHNLQLVLEYCEQAVVMDFGSVLSSGEPASCLRDPAVQEAYFGSNADAERLASFLEL